MRSATVQRRRVRKHQARERLLSPARKARSALLLLCVLCFGVALCGCLFLGAWASRGGKRFALPTTTMLPASSPSLLRGASLSAGTAGGGRNGAQEEGAAVAQAASKVIMARASARAAGARAAGAKAAGGRSRLDRGTEVLHMIFLHLWGGDMPQHFRDNFEKFQSANSKRRVHLWDEDEILDLLSGMPRRVVLAVSWREGYRH